MNSKGKYAKVTLSLSLMLFSIYVIYLFITWLDIEPVAGVIAPPIHLVFLLIMSLFFTIAILLYESINEDLHQAAK